MQHLSVCSFGSNHQISLRRHVCTEIDQRSWQIFNHLIASGAKLLDFHGFKGAYLHEEVTNSRSSKELSCQFVPVLSNGEGLKLIWALLEFWRHCEIWWHTCATKKIKGYSFFWNSNFFGISYVLEQTGLLIRVPIIDIDKWHSTFMFHSHEYVTKLL